MNQWGNLWQQSIHVHMYIYTIFPSTCLAVCMSSNLISYHFILIHCFTWKYFSPLKSVWLWRISFSFFQTVSVPEDGENVSRQQIEHQIVWQFVHVKLDYYVGNVAQSSIAWSMCSDIKRERNPLWPANPLSCVNTHILEGVIMI